MRYSLIAVAVAAALVRRLHRRARTTCAPPCTVPANFRAPEPLPPPQAASLADLKWFEVFKDEKLQDLIRTALAQNYDLRDAVARVEAGARQSRHHALEPIPASQRQRRPRIHAPLARWPDCPCPRSFLPNQNRNWGQAALNLLSFEVDIWGTPAPRHRSRARQSPERRGEPQGRGHHAGERRRHATTSICASSITNWRFRSDTLETRQDSLRLDPGAPEAAASRRCSICARPSNW